MKCITSVIDAYRARGFEVRTGLNPGHFANDRSAPYTYILQNNRVVSTGGGLALQEIFFLDLISRAISPNTVFIIGNAFGWSTLALSSLLPNATVIAIDSCIEGNEARLGFDLTNQLIEDLGLNARLAIATSPDDVGPIVSRDLGAIDLALIDGLHTNEQQLIDFNAIRPFMSDRSVIVFHDVIDWGMEESFQNIARIWHGRSHILMRTPSGLGVCYTENLEEEIGWIVSLFSERCTAGFARNPIPDIIRSFEQKRRSPLRRISRRLRGKKP